MNTVGQWLTAIEPGQRLEMELLLAECLAMTRTAIITHPETALDAQPPQQPPAWLHGDLLSGNVLINQYQVLLVTRFDFLS